MLDSGVDVPVDEILERLDGGRLWSPSSREDADGHVSVSHALRLCQYEPGDASVIEQVARRLGWGGVFEEDSDVSFEVVAEELDRHRRLSPGELEETFGPHWQPTVWVTRRVAALTAGEIERLREVRDVSEGAEARIRARAAVEGAAWGQPRVYECQAAEDAVMAAAESSAGLGFWDAARAAISDLIGAVTVSDLVGQHRLDQQSIDVLVHAWESVIGPVPQTAQQARS